MIFLKKREKREIFFVSLKGCIILFFLGGAGAGLTNERPGTGPVISWPMKGLGKYCTQWRRATDRR